MRKFSKKQETSFQNKHQIINIKHQTFLEFGYFNLFVTWFLGYLILCASPTYALVDITQVYGFGYVRSLGQGVNLLVVPTFAIATVVVVMFFLIGAFRYLTSGGDKEAVAGARGMITHAIIGFVILMFSFLILQFLLSNLFGIKTGIHFDFIGGSR